MIGLPQVLRYPGSKARIAAWIVSHFPAHDSYVEPFCGSAVVLCAKPPSPLETINDRDGRIVNLFRVIRDDPQRLAAAVAFTPWARAEYELSLTDAGDDIERARRFLVRCWQGFNSSTSRDSGWLCCTRMVSHAPECARWATVADRIEATARRLQNVQIENCDALALIRKVSSPNVLIYADPPYLSEEGAGRRYQFEMNTHGEHRTLAAALLEHPGPVFLSAYDHPLYTELFVGWRWTTRPTTAMNAVPRQEGLWMNEAATHAGQGQFEW